MAYGMTGHCGIAAQAAYGTANITSLDYFPLVSESITESIEVLVAEGMRGRFDEPAYYEGPHDVSGDIVTEVHPLLLGKLLRAFTGHSSGTQVGSVYSHQFLPAQADFSALSAVVPHTIEVYRDAGSAFQYHDMGLNTLVLEIANGAIDKATAGWVGGQFAWVAKTAPSYDTGSYFTWDSTSISLAGSAIDKITQMTITMTSNIEAKHTLNGTKSASRLKRTGFRTVEVSGTMLFEDDVEAKIFKAITRQRILLTATGASITGSQSNLFKIDLPSLVYNAYPVNMGGPGLIEVGFTGKAEYNVTSSYASEYTVINTQSTYL